MRDLFAAVLGIAALTCVLTVLSSPAWIAGVVVALKTRTMPVPMLLRAAWLRWAIWGTSGLIGYAAAILAVGYSAKALDGVTALLAGVALLGFAASYVAAFYIGWTTVARIRAHRRDAGWTVRPYHEPPSGSAPGHVVLRRDPD